MVLATSVSTDDAANENPDEPLERVLIHRVHLLQIEQTKEQDLGALRDRDVQRPSRIDIRLGCLS